MIQTTRWDAADHLGSREAVLAYLEAVFEDGDPALITAAVDDVARANAGNHLVVEPTDKDMFGAAAE